MCVYIEGVYIERETETEAETERDRQTDRQTDREAKTERQRQREMYMYIYVLDLQTGTVSPFEGLSVRLRERFQTQKSQLCVMQTV